MTTKKPQKPQKPRSAQARVVARALAHTCEFANTAVPIDRWAQWCVIEGLGCGRGATLALSLCAMGVPFVEDEEEEVGEGDLAARVARAIEDAWQEACRAAGMPWELFERLGRVVEGGARLGRVVGGGA